jgi:hypothetical protein
MYVVFDARVSQVNSNRMRNVSDVSWCCSLEMFERERSIDGEVTIHLVLTGKDCRLQSHCLHVSSVVTSRSNASNR